MITVNNFSKRAIDGNFLKTVAKIVLKGENVKIKDISIVLVKIGEIRNLNKKYRKKDRATDVLSFDYSGFAGTSSAYSGVSGEVVMCAEEIKKNAEKSGNSFRKEIARMLIHGILHLSGYEHEKSKKEAKKMEQKENAYFKMINQNAEV